MTLLDDAPKPQRRRTSLSWASRSGRQWPPFLLRRQAAHRASHRHRPDAQESRAEPGGRARRRPTPRRQRAVVSSGGWLLFATVVSIGGQRHFTPGMTRAVPPSQAAPPPAAAAVPSGGPSWGDPFRSSSDQDPAARVPAHRWPFVLAVCLAFSPQEWPAVVRS